MAQALDNSVSQEVTNHLFQEPGKKWGLDLASLNIQRGREHGVPSYNKWREFCGFKRIRAFHELHGIMNNQTVKGYEKYYHSPDDIDLWSAGVIIFEILTGKPMFDGTSEIDMLMQIFRLKGTP